MGNIYQCSQSKSATQRRRTSHHTAPFLSKMWNNSNSLPTFGSPSSRRTVIAKRRTGSIRETSAPATGFQQRANTGLGGLVTPFKDLSETAVVLPAQ